MGKSENSFRVREGRNKNCQRQNHWEEEKAKVKTIFALCETNFPISSRSSSFEYLVEPKLISYENALVKQMLKDNATFKE